MCGLLHMIDGQDLGYFGFVRGILVTILTMDLAKMLWQIRVVVSPNSILLELMSLLHIFQLIYLIFPFVSYLIFF